MTGEEGLLGVGWEGHTNKRSSELLGCKRAGKGTPIERSSASQMVWLLAEKRASIRAASSTPGSSSSSVPPPAMYCLYDHAQPFG